MVTLCLILEISLKSWFSSILLTLTDNLVTSAPDWYFENHSDESRTDYDSNGDGYLDGVILVYAAPESS